MNRFAKFLCLVALLAVAFLLAPAEVPSAEAHYCGCSLQDIQRCDDYCASRGCIGNCRNICSDQCICYC